MVTLELIPILITYYTEIYELAFIIGIPITVVCGIIIGLFAFKKDVVKVSAILCSVVGGICLIIFFRLLYNVISVVVSDFLQYLIVIFTIGLLTLALIVIFMSLYLAFMLGAIGGRFIANRYWDEKKKKKFMKILYKN